MNECTIPTSVHPPRVLGSFAETLTGQSCTQGQRSTCQEKATEALQDSEGRVRAAQGEWHFIVETVYQQEMGKGAPPGHTPHPKESEMRPGWVRAWETLAGLLVALGGG